MQPIYDEQDRLAREYKEAVKQYQQDFEEYKEAKQAHVDRI